MIRIWNLTPKTTMLLIALAAITGTNCNKPNISDTTEKTTTLSITIYNYDLVAYELYVNGSAHGTIGSGTSDGLPGVYRLSFTDKFVYGNGPIPSKQYSIDIRRTISGSVVIYDAGILVNSAIGDDSAVLIIRGGHFVAH